VYKTSGSDTSAEVLSLFDHDPVVALMTTKTENKDTPKTQSGEVEDKSTSTTVSPDTRDGTLFFI
jgi:hypothetical protein